MSASCTRARRAFVLGLTASCLAAAATSAQQGPAFQGLGHLSVRSDGYRYAYPVKISDDGSTVTGYSDIYGGSSTLGREAFYWRNGALRSLGAINTRSDDLRDSYPYDISGNGLVIVGESAIFSGPSSLGTEACRWFNGSLQRLGTLGYSYNGYRFSIATGVSSSGSAVSGYSQRYSGYSSLGSEAVRWINGSMQPLGALSYRSDGYRDSYGNAISADGSRVVGYSAIYSGLTHLGYHPFRWAGGMQDLGALSIRSDSYRFSTATHVSADGSTVAGWGRIYAGSNELGIQPFYWKNGGSVLLGALSYRSTDGNRWAIPAEVSADGSVVIGSSNLYAGANFLGQTAIRWEDGRMQSLGALAISYNGSRTSSARDVSADGSAVVGYSYPPKPGGRHRAFIWTEDDGMEDLGAILETEFGVDLSQWILYDANSISADGTIIAGYGYHSIGGQSYREPWIARLGDRNKPPTLACPSPGATFECDSSTTPDNQPGAVAELQTTVQDADGDPLTVTWKVAGSVAQTTTSVASGSVSTFAFAYPLGSSLVEVTVDDGTVSETCSTVVTVIDTTLPALTCQPPVSATTDPGDCVASAVSLVPPSVSDTCQVAGLSHDAPAVFPLGETVVTWTVTDVGGNQATCQQTVTVTDNEAPAFTCPPDFEIAHDPGSTIATGVEIGLPGSISDNCDPDGGSVVVEAIEPDEYQLGENTVTWIARDSAGNVNTCDQTVTVTNQDPIATCPQAQTLECHDISETDGDGAVATVVTLDAIVADADEDPLTVSWLVDGAEVATQSAVAPGSTVTLEHAFDYGESTVVLVVGDGIIEIDCEVKVTIVDTTVPSAVCNQDVVVGTDPGTCEASGVTLPTPSVSDNCEIVSLTNDAPPVYPIGETTVTWTVTDIGGNQAVCTQVVTVVDDERPVLAGPADVTVAHDPNQCLASGVALGSPQGATDNCGVVSVSNDAPETFPLGETTVVWTALDAAGNPGISLQTVTVTNAAPVADAGDSVVAECAEGGATVTLDGGGSTDPEGDDLTFHWSAVGIDFDDASSTTPSATFPLGSHSVTLVVEDSCGSVDSSTVYVLVQDTVAPVIQVTTVDPEVLWPPNHEMIAVGINLLVSDDCQEPANLNVTCTVSSSEADDTTGDGQSTGDVGGQDGHTAPVPVQIVFNPATGSWQGTIELRAERSGGGDGRKYDITCLVSDGTNTTTGTACVVVPKSQGGGKGRGRAK